MSHTLETEKREFNDTEKELIAGGRKVLRGYFLKILKAGLHPDGHHRGVTSSGDRDKGTYREDVVYSPEWQKQEADVGSKEGVKRVHEILSALLDKIDRTPEMCVARGNGIEILNWPDIADLDEETLIYFPKSKNLPEARFVSLPATPKDFLHMIDGYISGDMRVLAYRKPSAIHKLTGKENTRDWMRKMRIFIQFIRDAKTLDDLHEMIKPIPKGRRFPAAHINSFTLEDRRAGVLLDGKHVFIETEIDSRALQIIQENADSVGSENELVDFLYNLSKYGFFRKESRFSLNTIVRRVISKQLEKTKNPDAVDRLWRILEESMRGDSSVLKKLTPQVRGLIRYSFEQKKIKLGAE